MKAILRMEMPSMCCYCPCCSSSMQCNAAGQRDVSNRIERLGWCPIKPAEDAPETEDRCYLGGPCPYQTQV